MTKVILKLTDYKKSNKTYDGLFYIKDKEDIMKPIYFCSYCEKVFTPWNITHHLKRNYHKENKKNYDKRKKKIKFEYTMDYILSLSKFNTCNTSDYSKLNYYHNPKSNCMICNKYNHCIESKCRINNKIKNKLLCIDCRLDQCNKCFYFLNGYDLCIYCQKGMDKI